MNQTLHMGLWTVYYDENGEGQVVWSDEFRKMLHVSKEEFPDSMDVLTLRETLTKQLPCTISMTRL